MNYIELQKMRKEAGLGWGWVNDLVGDDNIVSDVFGNNRQQRLDNYANQFRQQMNQDLGPATLQRQQQGAADWDRRVAEAGQQLDRRLAATQQRQQQQRQQQLAQDQAAASQRNANLMSAYMAGNNEQLAQQNQLASQGFAPTNQQLTSNIGNARRQVAAQQPQRNYQAFDRNNLSGYTQDQINAINAAAQKKGLKMGDITQVSFGNNGAVNGFRVRKGTLNKQPQQPVATKPNAQIASTPTDNVYDARKI